MNISIAGYDVSGYCTNSELNLDYTLPEAGGIVTGTTVSMDFDNFANILSESLFYNKELKDISVRISGDTGIVWYGFLNSIRNSNDTLTLTAQDFLYDLSIRDCLYLKDSSSPAEIAKSIFYFYLPVKYHKYIDDISFDIVKNYQELNDVFARLSALPSNNTSIMNVLQKLCDIGIMSIYYDGKIRCRFYDAVLNGISIPDDDILELSIDKSVKDAFDGYSIASDSGNIAFNSTGKNVKNLEGGMPSDVSLTSLVGATYIGESYLKYSARENVRFQMKVLKKYSGILKLGNGIVIDGKTFVIDRIRYGSKLSIDIEGRLV